MSVWDKAVHRRDTEEHRGGPAGLKAEDSLRRLRVPLCLCGESSNSPLHSFEKCSNRQVRRQRGYTLYSETEPTLAEFTRELMAHVKENRLKMMLQEFPLAQAADLLSAA